MLLLLLPLLARSTLAWCVPVTCWSSTESHDDPAAGRYGGHCLSGALAFVSWGWAGQAGQWDVSLCKCTRGTGVAVVCVSTNAPRV
jgi:hypothetical protein